MEKINKDSETISAAFGLPTDAMDEAMGKAFAALVSSSSHTESVNKLFPELTDKQKLQVIAYGVVRLILEHERD